VLISAETSTINISVEKRNSFNFWQREKMYRPDEAKQRVKHENLIDFVEKDESK
jgi:hypothetical protein